jgi:L-rhamnose mutarotase
MNEFKRYCQALDLVQNDELIAEYISAHKHIWPEVTTNIRASGVLDMQIWRIGNRLFMIMDVDDSFTFERAAQLAQGNPVVQKWEEVMWKYQVPTPWTPKGEKWVLMDQIFSLTQQPEV